MPNLCISSYYLSCDDTKTAEHIFYHFDKWKTEGEQKSETNEWSLYKIGLEAGLTKEELSECNTRGNIIFIDTYDHKVFIEIESAWIPTYDLLHAIIEKYFKNDIKDIKYECEELSFIGGITNRSELIGTSITESDDKKWKFVSLEDLENKYSS
jgi:hypothetical protein